VDNQAQWIFDAAERSHLTDRLDSGGPWPQAGIRRQVPWPGPQPQAGIRRQVRAPKLESGSGPGPQAGIGSAGSNPESGAMARTAGRISGAAGRGKSQSPRARAGSGGSQAEAGSTATRRNPTPSPARRLESGPQVPGAEAKGWNPGAQAQQGRAGAGVESEGRSPGQRADAKKAPAKFPPRPSFPCYSD
jgi:hypothetical protein